MSYLKGLFIEIIRTHIPYDWKVYERGILYQEPYGSIAHEAKPNGPIDPWPLRAKGRIVLVSPN